MLASGLARAAEPDGRALEHARRYADALAAYQACAAADGPDARFCAARVAALTPQAADDFAGWAVLDAVQQDYRTLGPDEATRRVQAALDAHPDSPAAPAMRLWLARQLTHVAPASPQATEAREAARTDPATSDNARATLDAVDARLARVRRQRGIAGALGAVAAAYVGVAAVGLRRGARPPSPAVLGVGAAMLAGVPAAMAWAWGAAAWPWFGCTGAAAVAGAALAPGAPPWLAAPGSAALVGVAVWAAGWFDTLGVG